MTNKNRENKFFIFGIVLIFLAFIFVGKSFLSAQFTEITEISSADFTYYATGYEISQDGEIIFNSEDSKLIINQGQENEIIIEGSSGIKISPLGKISVTESGSAFLLNGNEFKNIESGSIELDQKTGKITKADFYTNKNLGNYNINGNEFNVLSNSRFVYNSKEEKFYLRDGAEILTAKDIQIETLENELINYKGNKVSGILNFDENGNAFVKIREKAVINGVLIENSGDKLYGKEANLPIFFDKSAAKTYEKINPRKAYAIIDKESGFFAFKEQTGTGLANHNINMKFKKENYLFGDLMDDQDHVAINQGSNNADGGYLEISRPNLEDATTIRNQGLGEVVLENGARNFNFNGRELSLSRTKRDKIGTVSMVLETTDLEKTDPKDPKIKIIEEGIAIWIIEEKEFNQPKVYWMDKKISGELIIQGGGYLAGEKEVSEEFKEKLKKGAIVFQEDLDKFPKIVADKKFENFLKASKTADKELKDIYNNKQIGLKEVIQKNPQGISFNDLEKEIGPANAQRVKSRIKDKIRIYYEYYNPTDKDNQLQKVMGVNELNNFNNCITSGANFDDCFDHEYNFYGSKTERCIIDPDFCPIMNAVKLYSTSSY